MIDPYEEMLRLLDEADKKRLRITHWGVNDPMLVVIAAHPSTNRDCFLTPISEQEFLGIPLRLLRVRETEPILWAIHERYGRDPLIYTYEGPIMHGNSSPYASRSGHV